MKKICLDTNVLISLKIERDPFFSKAEKILKDCFNGKTIIYIPLAALLEIEWVLRSFYKQSRMDITTFLEELLIIENVETDDKETFRAALSSYRETKVLSIVDALILRQVLNKKGYNFLTFDKDLEKIYQSLI